LQFNYAWEFVEKTKLLQEIFDKQEESNSIRNRNEGIDFAQPAFL